MNLFSKLYNNRWLVAIRWGLLQVQTLVIIGCMMTLFIHLPVERYQIWIHQEDHQFWLDILTWVQNSTVSIISLLSIITVSFSLAEWYRRVHEGEQNPLTVSIVSLSSVILLGSQGGASMADFFGVKGLLICVFLSLVATEIYIKISQLSFLQKHAKSYTNGTELRQTYQAFVPALITVVVFAIVKVLLAAIGIEDLFLAVYSQISLVIMKLVGFIHVGILYIVGSHALWFMGVHGGNVFEILNETVFQPNLMDNITAEAVGVGQSFIFTKPFFDSFVTIGGCGATLCLILAILLVNEHENSKTLAKISLLPGIFNINELIVYGLPIIVNPIYLIPFVGVPLVLMCISYTAMFLGLVPCTIGEINWITPVLFNGYFAVYSWQGVVLQGVNIVVGTMLYIPFVRIANKMAKEEEQKWFNQLNQGMVDQQRFSPVLTTSRGEVGIMAKRLVHDLEVALASGQELYLQYQPQVNQQEKVVGVEALLRWKHHQFGNVPPNITVALAEETGLIHSLGKWVVHEACAQLQYWKNSGMDDVAMSINVSPLQLKELGLVECVREAIIKYQLQPTDIKIEITENISLGKDEVTHQQLKELDVLGVKLVIDDFGPGYNPILYLQQYNISMLKLDGSLVRNIHHDRESRDIVQAVSSLCQNSGIELVAEFVENLEQKKVLEEIGPCIYQGYLYSPPLLGEQCLVYIQEQQKS